MFKLVSSNRYAIPLLLVASICLSACGGGGGGGGNTPPPPPPPPANTTNYSFDLSVEEVVGGSNESGTANADIAIDEDSNILSGTISLSGLSADAVSLNVGFAGEVGTELLALIADNATTWSIPADTELTGDQRASLDNGEIFIRVTTAANPNGALRGQIVPDDITLIITPLSQAQSIPPTGSTATANGFFTLNTDNNTIAVRVVTLNFPDATLAHVHQALAGLSGGIAVSLTQDTSNPALWSNEGNEETLDSDGIAELNSGGLYFNVHGTNFPDGEIRGQILPDGIDVVLNDLTGDDVVTAGISGVVTDASAIAASTIDLNTMQLTTHINTTNLDDALSATINQAPAGQNGPSIADFEQDGSELSLWSAVDVSLSASQFAALQNQGLYFTVTTPDEMDGEVRGQLIPTVSMMSSADVFQVTDVSPEEGSEVGALPSTAIITFNREVLSASLSINTITFTASGGDGSFGEGNDVPVSGISTSASDDTVIVDFNGISVNDDIYQLTIVDAELSDSNGVILDGDKDGEIGGEFTTTFNIITPPNPNATFSAIQSNVFTPICSGCHGGAAPRAGLSLEAGVAYNNIVNANSTQSALLRIEPNNPDDSYLIRKIQGEPDIAGERMPLGGPFLPQSTIDDIRQWVSEGALNN